MQILKLKKQHIYSINLFIYSNMTPTKRIRMQPFEMEEAVPVAHGFNNKVWDLVMDGVITSRCYT